MQISGRNSFLNFVERPILKLPLSLLCCAPFLHDRELSEGEGSGEKGARNREEEG